jgi:hypothetical protein
MLYQLSYAPAVASGPIPYDRFAGLSGLAPYGAEFGL